MLIFFFTFNVVGIASYRTIDSVNVTMGFHLTSFLAVFLNIVSYNKDNNDAVFMLLSTLSTLSTWEVEWYPVWGIFQNI